MLLHAADLQVLEAEASEDGRFNKCLAALVLTSLAIEALINAVGSRAAESWLAFEKLKLHEKIEYLVKELQVQRDTTKEPWTTVRFLTGFRNDIAHAKPQQLETSILLPEAAIAKLTFDPPRSTLEREITVGNARRAHTAVYALKGIFTYALPAEKQFGIYTDGWAESVEVQP